MAEQPIRLLCVDDNDFIAEAIERKLARHPEFQYLGWLPTAEGLVERCISDRPDIVILDVDMPGKSGFEVLAELSEYCPEVRVVMLSGHAQRRVIDRAIDAGAWGFISKDEPVSALIEGIRRVARGEFVLETGAGEAHRAR